MDHPPPVLGVGADDRAQQHHAGVVHEDVEPAEFLPGAADGVAAGGLVGHVEVEREDRRPAVTEPRGERVQPVPASGADGDRGAGLGQGDGGRLADTRRRTGHQRDLALQGATDLESREPPPAPPRAAHLLPLPPAGPVHTGSCSGRGERHPEAVDGQAQQHRPRPQQVAHPRGAGAPRGRRGARRRRPGRSAAPRAAPGCWPTPSAGTPAGRAGSRVRLAGVSAPVQPACGGRRRAAGRGPPRRPGAARTSSIRSWSRRRSASRAGEREVLRRDHADQRLRQVEVDVRVHAEQDVRLGRQAGLRAERQPPRLGDLGRVRAVRLEGVEVEAGEVDVPAGHPVRVLERAAVQGRRDRAGGAQVRAEEEPARVPVALQRPEQGRHARRRARRRPGARLPTDGLQSSASRPSSGGRAMPASTGGRCGWSRPRIRAACRASSRFSRSVGSVVNGPSIRSSLPIR